MKKRNILTILIVLIILLFKIDVSAASCTSTEKSQLKQLARQMQINDHLDSNEMNPFHEHTYGVTFNNWSDQFYILDSYGTRYDYSTNHTSEKIYGQYTPGSVVTFKVYGAIGKTCAFEQLATFRVDFPYYNDYYLSPLCKGIEDFYLCQRNYSGKIESEAWFIEQINKYKASLTEGPVVEEENNNIIEKIFNYVEKNPIIILVFVVVIILIIVIIIWRAKVNKKKIKIDLNLK